ncbi:MAG: preprotein translocase subunit SecG [Rhodanobacter sp.]
MFVIFSVFYILIAAAMIVLILLQNGAGADAGSGFGGGASATVFGARGSGTFLTRATSVLAALFFILSITMGIYLHGGDRPQTKAGDLGVMGALTEKPAAKVPVAPATPAGSELPSATPAATNNAVPAKAAPAPTTGQPATVPAGEPIGKH